MFVIDLCCLEFITGVNVSRSGVNPAHKGLFRDCRRFEGETAKRIVRQKRARIRREAGVPNAIICGFGVSAPDQLLEDGNTSVR